MISSTTLTTNKEIENNICFRFSKELDYEFLEKNYFGNLEMALLIFEHFTQNIDLELAAIKKSVENDDFNEVSTIAHKIKNDFVYVGATKLSNLMQQLEKEANKEDPSIAETYKIFNTETEVFLKIISEQFDSIKTYLDIKT